MSAYIIISEEQLTSSFEVLWCAHVEVVSRLIIVVTMVETAKSVVVVGGGGGEGGFNL